MLLCGTVAAVASACGADLIDELKQVPYKIVCESYQDGNWDLFMVRADGSDRVNLTRTPGVNELYPHVSPDGTKISFEVDAGEGESTTRDVYWMNFDGTGRQLVARGARDGCWAADGRSIVYVKNEFKEFTVMDYVTKGAFRHDLATGREEEHPNRDLYHLFAMCCTPDGKWYIASVHGGMGFPHAIVAVEAQGRRVVDLKIPGCRPDVSRDGKRIAWASSDYSLGIGDLDLSGPEPRVVNARDVVVSNQPIKVQHVDWSPDGRYVAFSRGLYKKGLGRSPALVGLRAPGWNICVADAMATNRWVAITSDGNSNKEPDWVAAAK
jgi:Tol biopolymer transport system component